MSSNLALFLMTVCVCVLLNDLLLSSLHLSTSRGPVFHWKSNISRLRYRHKFIMYTRLLVILSRRLCSLSFSGEEMKKMMKHDEEEENAETRGKFQHSHPFSVLTLKSSHTDLQLHGSSSFQVVTSACSRKQFNGVVHFSQSLDSFGLPMPTVPEADT